MAALDEFFEKALNTARDLGKARVQRRQKQQEIENLATFSQLNAQDRNTRTAERRQLSDAELGQQGVELDKARLALRGELGREQLKISGRQAGVQERGATLEERGFQRTGDLFNRFFPDPDAGSSSSSSGIGPNFRESSDEGVLNSARSLVGTNRESGLANPKVQEVIRGARGRRGLRSSLEQDLLNLR